MPPYLFKRRLQLFQLVVTLCNRCSSLLICLMSSSCILCTAVSYCRNIKDIALSRSKSWWYAATDPAASSALTRILQLLFHTAAVPETQSQFCLLEQLFLCHLGNASPLSFPCPSHPRRLSGAMVLLLLCVAFLTTAPPVLRSSLPPSLSHAGICFVTPACAVHTLIAIDRQVDRRLVRHYYAQQISLPTHGRLRGMSPVCKHTDDLSGCRSLLSMAIFNSSQPPIRPPDVILEPELSWSASILSATDIVPSKLTWTIRTPFFWQNSTVLHYSLPKRTDTVVLYHQGHGGHSCDPFVEGRAWPFLAAGLDVLELFFSNGNVIAKGYRRPEGAARFYRWHNARSTSEADAASSLSGRARSRIRAEQRPELRALHWWG